MKKKNLKTFTMGGIHPEDSKFSSRSPIEDAGLPDTVYIPVKQHIGSPAKILVKPGDKVKVGTHLADADGIISADVFSSVSGEVIKVEEMEGNTGYLENMITIKVEGDVWEKSIDRSPDIVKEIPFSSEEILKKVREGGIVGMGGAGYPTPAKMAVPSNKKIRHLIVNGIECEPYLTTDDRLMVEKAEEIIIGARIINKALGIQNAIIAIEENKPEAIEVMKKIAKGYVGVNVRVLQTKYPQGSEKQLVEAITGREIPSGKLPIDIGCIVQNVGTIFAIYETVMKNKPLFERIVTVSGNAADEKKNFRVRVGTPASFLIKKVCKNIDNVGKIIFGGPMMGLSAINIDAPITKLTSGVLLMNQKKAHKPSETPCIRCGKCNETCPMGLRPFAIVKAIKDHDFGLLNDLSVLDCIECASCVYVCPARIPLLEYFKLGKVEIRCLINK
jgi:electron transport complex protein RnfC